MSEQVGISMEASLGWDFSRVRIHTDPTAARSAGAVGANAYTVGHDIVFSSGTYAPATAGGRRLLAHELTHVAQQQAGGGDGEVVHLGRAYDPAEAEADAVARAVAEPDTSRTIAPARPLPSPTGPVLRRQASSSPSSGSSGPKAGAPPTPDAGAGPACRIDVRATHIGQPGQVIHEAPVWHLFVVYTDSAGTAHYFRGGPGGSCGAPAGDYGTIQSTAGPYVAGTVDWDPAAPSTTVLSGPSACGKDACFASELTRIDGTCATYEPTGPNSNTVAKTILSKCGAPQAKPVLIAPGWDDPEL